MQDLDRVLEAAVAIQAEAGLRVCASFGQLRPHDLARLRGAGISRYNHNLETSERFFASVCTTHGWRDRVRTARAATGAGLELCSGGLVGLGETDEDRVDLALAVRDLGATVVPINVLNPIPGTPLGDAPRLAPLKILAIIAVFRLMMPDVTLKLAGGREFGLGTLQPLMFAAGADACMVGDYLTTPGRSVEDDLAMLRDLDLEPAGADHG